jgi:hypothetical protein
MRHALLFSPALLALIAAVAISCGGSSSETPPPVEPEGASLGPAAETVTPQSIIEERAARDAGPGGGRRKTP